MPEPRAWIGTSGWNYKHWRDTFYPKGLPAKDWLGHYTAHFDTVEINNSFYRIPAPGIVARWDQQTPDVFCFAPKLWRGITHYRRLRNTSEFLQAFFRVANELSPRKRGPLLIQLPPQQPKDLDRVQSFLEELRAVDDDAWPVVMEFRNDEWLAPDAYRVLSRLNVTICLHDMTGRGAATRPNDVPLVYVRRHGSKDQRYGGSYSPGDLGRDAESIDRWLGEGRQVYVYFNNDIGGHAFRNALDLKALLSRQPSETPAS